MSDYSLEELSAKIDELIVYCQQLKQDKTLLQQKEDLWLQERERLIEKNELARTRVQAMISHLKNLEQGVG